jgi:hypothetical protein
MESKKRKRIALKYCGGCDSTYDRVRYWQRINEVTAGKIEWVSIEEPPFETVLLINGCSTACKERDLEHEHDWRIVSVKDDNVDPEIIVNQLLKE